MPILHPINSMKSMKKRLLFATAMLAAAAGHAQITVNDTVIPSAGDTFRYSYPTANITVDVSQTGANHTWNFANFTPDAQDVQQWKTVVQVNPAWALNIPTSAIGFKLLDSLDFGGVSAQAPHVFFQKKTTPSTTLSAVGYGITFSGIPVSASYSDNDEWFFYPLNYTNGTDVQASTYRITATLLTYSIMMKGTRETVVDGWGTITTPYYTSGVSALRVKSTVNEVDSIDMGGGQAMTINRQTTDYFWLTANDKFPALWVTETSVAGQPSDPIVRYRDNYRHITTGLSNVNKNREEIKTYPNPSANGLFTVSVPKGWNEFTVEVYDMSGKLVAAQKNNTHVNLAAQPAGQYLVRMSNFQNQAGFSLIQKL